MSQVVQNKTKPQEFQQDIIINKRVIQPCYIEQNLISTISHFTLTSLKKKDFKIPVKMS